MTPTAQNNHRCTRNNPAHEPDAIAITPTEQRQLAAITRRLEQVEPVVTAIYKATEHLPAADRLAVLERLQQLQPLTTRHMERQPTTTAAYREPPPLFRK